MEWWKKYVFYEIYVPSFYDGNQDGIGDLKGIVQKMPYLKELGIGAIWLTPFYPSPKVDNGYDISDYCDVDSVYGTLDDFEKLVEEAHEMGIKVIIDVVLNHASTAHPWFTEAAESKESAKRDWFIWRDQPNNWESFFGGSAWNYDERTAQYYYHSFAKEQADLNWCNLEVQQAMLQVLDFWVDKGVDGFRLDVINNLTVSDDFQDNPIDSNGDQLHQFDVNQKGIYETLAIIRKHLKEKNKQLFMVGEISSDDLAVIRSYADENLFDVTFNFNFGSIPQFSVNEIASELCAMQREYGNDKWPTLFFNSHDMNRSWNRLAQQDRRLYSLFAVLILLNHGVSFLFQGEELGTGDFLPQDFTEVRDIQAKNKYKLLIQGKVVAEKALEEANKVNRDRSRGMIVWPDTMVENGWIGSGKTNIEQQEIFGCYQKLIRIRKQYLSDNQNMSNLQWTETSIYYQVGELQVLLNFGDQELYLPDDWQFSEPILASFELQGNMPVVVPSRSFWIGRTSNHD